MATPNFVRKIVDHDGAVYYLAAIVPGVDATISMLPQGQEPEVVSSVNEDGTITMNFYLPPGPTGVSVADISFVNNIMVIAMTDGTTYRFDGIATQLGQMEEATLAAEDAAEAANDAATLADQKATAANTAASQATAAKNAANTAASEATAAKTAAETATTEAQAATTAATNAATAANNAAQTALASVGNMLIGEYADTTGGQMFTTEDAYATGTLHGLTVYGKSIQVQDPAPTPDAPQEIKSVADGNIKLTGKCIWGGEQMADDIVAAVNNSAYAWKGEDADGKYVAVKASSIVSATTFFKASNVGHPLTFIITGKKIDTTLNHSNIAFKYLDSDTRAGIPIALGNVVVGQVYTNAVTSTDFTIADIVGLYASGTCYIYYERSGLFKGTITADDFTPFDNLGTLDFLPTGVEPLRSLPDGTCDVLRIDKDGNGVIERNVKKIVINGESTFLFEDSNRLAYLTGIDTNWMRRTDDYRLTMMADTLPINKNHTRMAQSDRMAITGYYTANTNPGKNWIYVSDLPSELQTASALSDFFGQHETEVLGALVAPVTEIIPASRMPKVPSQYLHAWLDASDQNRDAIDPAWGMEYERDLTITINNIESAIADIVSA